MFAKADIVLARKDSVIVIPKDIIISGQRGKTVFIVDNGTADEKRITIGYENQNEAEITSGLKMNDRLVIKGFETLKNRSKLFPSFSTFKTNWILSPSPTLIS